MPNNSSMPTSGLFVLLSTTVAGMIGKLALPWTEYQVLLWTGSHPGITFPPGYAQLLAEIATVIFQIGIGVGHLLVISAYRMWPEAGLLTALFARKPALDTRFAGIGLREPYDLGKHEPPTPPAA